MELNALVTRQFLRRLRSSASLMGLLLCLLGVAFFFMLAYRDLMLGMQRDPLNVENAAGLILLWGYRDAVLAVLIAIAPLLGVRAVSEEREGRTLDFLATAPLSRLAFLSAKVGSTMLQITLGIIATLPLVTLTALMGGVGPWDLFWCFAAHITSAFFYLVLGWYAGHQNVPAGQALQGAYGLVALFHGPVLLMLIGYVGLASSGALSKIAMGEGLYAMLGFNIIMTVSNFFAGSLFLINVSKRLGEDPRPNRRLRIIRRKKNLRVQLWNLLGTVEEDELLPDTTDPVYMRDLKMLRENSFASFIDLPCTLVILSMVSSIAFTIPAFMVWIGLIVAWIPNVLLSSRILSREFEHETWELLSTLLRPNKSLVQAKYQLAIRYAWLLLYAYLLPAGVIFGMYVLIRLPSELQQGNSYEPFVLAFIPYMLTLAVLGFCTVWFGTVGMAVSVWTRRQYPAVLLGLSIVGGFVIVPVLAGSVGEIGQDIARFIHPAFAIQLFTQKPVEGLTAIFVQMIWMSSASLLLYRWILARATARY